MAGIKASDTKPELLIRRGLHALGIRYRLGKNYRVEGRLLPGKPDLVFPGQRAVIMINGCFWHGHSCHLFRWPTSNEPFWREKIAGNIARDRKVREQLMATGWRLLEIWECTLKGRERKPIDEVLEECGAFINGNARFASIGADEVMSVELAI